jgi:hypothetical protein
MVPIPIGTHEIFENLGIGTFQEINEDAFFIEFNQYLKKGDQVIDSQSDPVQFWKFNSMEYLMLAKLAKQILGVPA